jgi:hypothetical protein
MPIGISNNKDLEIEKIAVTLRSRRWPASIRRDDPEGLPLNPSPQFSHQ